MSKSNVKADPDGAFDNRDKSIESIAKLRIFNRRLTAILTAMANLPSEIKMNRTLVASTYKALEDLPEPYGRAIVELQSHIAKGSTLSSGLRKFPELFPDIYVVMVQAGELGGTHDIWLERLCKLLQLDWRVAVASAAGGTHEWSIMFRPNTDRNFDELSRREQLATLILVCETLRTLLTEGVPIIQTLDLVAAAMPGEAAKAVMAEASQAVRSGQRFTHGLQKSGLFPVFVIELINSGERSGTLDITLHEAARALTEELEIEIGQPLSL